MLCKEYSRQHVELLLRCNISGKFDLLGYFKSPCTFSKGPPYSQYVGAFINLMDCELYGCSLKPTNIFKYAMVSSALTPINCLFIWNNFTSICISSCPSCPKDSDTHMLLLVLQILYSIPLRHLAWSLGFFFLQGCYTLFWFRVFCIFGFAYSHTNHNDTCFHGAPDTICFMGQRCCWPPDGRSWQYIIW